MEIDPCADGQTGPADDIFLCRQRLLVQVILFPFEPYADGSDRMSSPQILSVHTLMFSRSGWSGTKSKMNNGKY
jgi:hypothetical protein